MSRRWTQWGASGAGSLALGVVVGLSTRALVGLLVSLLLVAVLVAPEVGFLTLAVLRPLLDQLSASGGVFVFGQSLSVVLGGGIVCMSLVAILSQQRRGGRARLHAWWVPLAYTCIVMLWTQDRGYGIGLIARIGSWVTVVTAMSLSSRREMLLRWVPRCASLAVLIISASLVWSAVTGVGNSGYYGLGELYGGYHSPQDLAFPIVVLVPALVLGVRNDRNVWGWVALLAFVAGLGGVVVSLVRAAWLAWAGVVVASTPLIRDASPSAKRRLSLALIVACVAGALLLVPRASIVQERWADLNFAGSSSTQAVGSGRGAIYAAVWHAFESSTPAQALFGHGLGYSEVATARELGYVRVAHSDVLWFVLETGLLGTVLGIWASVILAVDLRRLSDMKSPTAKMAQVALASGAGVLVLAVLNGVVADGPTMYQFALIAGAALGGRTSGDLL